MIEDKEITCKDCGQSFFLTPGEQDFFANRVGDDGQKMQEPKRCVDCRAKKKARYEKLGNK